MSAHSTSERRMITGSPPAEKPRTPIPNRITQQSSPATSIQRNPPLAPTDAGTEAGFVRLSRTLPIQYQKKGDRQEEHKLRCKFESCYQCDKRHRQQRRRAVYCQKPNPCTRQCSPTPFSTPTPVSPAVAALLGGPLLGNDQRLAVPRQAKPAQQPETFSNY
jgi:hypothetical protein